MFVHGEEPRGAVCSQEGGNGAIPVLSGEKSNQSFAPAEPQFPEPQTQDTLTFTGVVVRDRAQVVLKDPVTRVVYQLDDASRAKPYLGKQVRIVGKLGMDTNTIHVSSVEIVR